MDLRSSRWGPVLDRRGRANSPTGAPLDERRPDLPRYLRGVAMARPAGGGGGGRPCRFRGERAHPRRGAVSRSRCSAADHILCGGTEVGHCIEAMAGCRSGNSTISSFRKEAWPASASGFGGCRGATLTSMAILLISDFEAERFERLRSCKGTNGRGADRHRGDRAARFFVAHGSSSRPLSGRAQPGPRASDDVPRAPAVRRGRVARSRLAQSFSRSLHEQRSRD